MNGITWALIGTLFTFSVTTLGALNVFGQKRSWQYLSMYILRFCRRRHDCGLSLVFTASWNRKS